MTDANAPARSQPDRSNQGQKLKGDLKVVLYASLLVLVFDLAQGYIVTVPFAFLLKNGLKLGPSQMSLFGIFGDCPMWVGFAFGFLRDRWRPFGRGDSAYFIASGVLLAITYLVQGFGPLTYGSILVASIFNTAFGAMAGAAARGVTAAVAKQHGLTGTLAVIFIVSSRLSLIIGNAVGGALGQSTSRGVPFLLAAAVALLLSLFGVWKPRFIYPGGEEPYEAVFVETNREAWRRLLRHKAVYVPAVMVLLWSFAPGWGTPLLFYLTNQIKLSEAQFGSTMGVLSLGALVAALLYPVLCRVVNVRPLLIVGTILGVLGGPIFLFIHTPSQAGIIAFVAGFSCGIATCTYWDVLFRTCPKELEGIVAMLFAGAYAFGTDVSDLVGSWLYERGGFGLALAATAVSTGAILLFVPLIPKVITKPMEGTPIVDDDVPESVPVPA